MLANLTTSPTFKDRVSEHIQNGFSALISDEEFKLLVEAEIHSFFKETRELKFAESGYRNYTSNFDLTPFQQLVWQAIHPKVKTKVEEVFKGGLPLLDKFLSDMVASSAVQERVVMDAQTLALKMVGTLFTDIAVNTSTQARNELRQCFYNANMPELAARLN